jgi:hypothetical protein
MRGFYNFVNLFHLLLTQMNTWRRKGIKQQLQEKNSNINTVGSLLPSTVFNSKSALTTVILFRSP